MAVETAQGKRYSLVVPYLAWAYRYLGAFKETFGYLANVWALGFSIGLVRVLFPSEGIAHFPQSHSTVTWQTRFEPKSVPYMAAFSTIECSKSSQLLWYQDRIKFHLYNHSMDPVNKTIVGTAATLVLDFTYLVMCRPSSLYIEVDNAYVPTFIVLLASADSLGITKSCPG